MKSLSLLLLLIIFSACTMSSSKSVPDEVVVYDKIIRTIPIHFEDSAVRQHRENGYQIAMIYLRGNDLVVPLFYMEMPKVGGGTRKIHLDVIRFAGDGQDFLYYADDTAVTKIIFLVQGVAQEKRGWRVHEVDVTQGFISLSIPGLESLRPIEEFENHQELTDLLDTAIAARFDLNS